MADALHPAVRAVGASLRRLIWFGATLALPAGALGLFGAVHWLLDLCAHFRWQYALISVLAGVLAALARRHRVALLFAASAAFNAALIVRTALDAPPPAATLPATRLRILVVNLHNANPTPQRLLDVVNAYRPDIVGVVELTPDAVTALEPLGRSYPAAAVFPDWDPFGAGLWSKVPDAHISRTATPPLGLTTLQLDYADAAGPARFVLTHTFPPIGAEHAAERDQHLRAIATLLGSGASDAIVAGDLNITPWSAAYRRLRADAGLYDSVGGHVPWPTWQPAPVLGLAFTVPIDHVLFGAHWRCVARELGPDVGSDHRPLIVTLERVAAQAPHGGP